MLEEHIRELRAQVAAGIAPQVLAAIDAARGEALILEEIAGAVYGPALPDEESMRVLAIAIGQLLADDTLERVKIGSGRMGAGYGYRRSQVA